MRGGGDAPWCPGTRAGKAKRWAVHFGDDEQVLGTRTPQIAAAASFLGYSSYAPTKFAVRGFADAIRNELLGTGVRVSIAYPPDTETPGFKQENRTKPPECARIAPPEVYSAQVVAKLILDGAAAGTYALSSPDVVQNLLISATAGITPTGGSTVVLAALSPLLTVASRLFGVWADHVARGYGTGLKKSQ